MITTEQLDEWAALCEAATPGPWAAQEYGVRGSDGATEYVLVGGHGFGLAFAESSEEGAATVELAAAARTAMPALIAEVRRLEAEKAKLLATAGESPPFQHPAQAALAARGFQRTIAQQRVSRS